MVMRKPITLLISFFLPLLIEAQQTKVDGYIIKMKDTIYCKILPEKRVRFLKTSVTVADDVDSTTEYLAGGPVRGFGFKEDSVVTHYGVVTMYDGNSRRKIYVKKIVLGTVELYQHVYSVFKTNRVTGVSQMEQIEDYYIASNVNGDLTTPFLLPSLKKKFIARYLYDYPDLEDQDKIITPAELIKLLKSFNSWYTRKRA
jgi:hypothetical protein